MFSLLKNYLYPDKFRFDHSLYYILTSVTYAPRYIGIFDTTEAKYSPSLRTNIMQAGAGAEEGECYDFLTSSCYRPKMEVATLQFVAPLLNARL